MDEEAAMRRLAEEPRLGLVADSYARLLGRPLVEPVPSLADALWRAPRVILAHGVEADPLFFYGNRQALALFEAPASRFIGMPSRLSAEPLERETRARLLARVAAHGFIDDYAGVRVSTSGRRFRIEGAVVWNLVDALGAVHGQAATFDRWTPLP